MTYQKYPHLCQSTNEELIARIYEKYQKKLQKSNSLDFDDLLLLPNILFNLKPEILEKWQRIFQYILVDEAQDTNQLQFDLIRQLA
ncbi:MAG: UvrD-helicase domain-containing protein [Patescibacteria group bacterium]